jgi:N-acetyl-gamma-glutamyl-phosphate reductase
MNVGVLGATGYTGESAVGLVARHPRLEVAAAVSGTQLTGALESAVAEVGGALTGLVGGAEVVVLALPHGVSQRVVPLLLDRDIIVVDLGADFRFVSDASYQEWYGVPHQAPEALSLARYGLVELFRKDLAGARLIAVPGCYVTAATLAVAPLVREGLSSEEFVIVDAYSGVSGAGKSPTAATHFVSVNESLSAYGLGGHRHTGEMEMVLERKVLFTPHLAPITRGILATCYVAPADGRVPVQGEELRGLYEDFYAQDRFVRITSDPPSTRRTYGTNDVLIHPTFDARAGRYVVVSALDNLVKGAAGQAIQALNVALGWDEDLGLEGLGVWP